MPRAIEAVIFDVDGVLVDSEPLWRSVEREVFGELGIEVSDADLVETMGVPIREVVELWYRRRPWDGPSREEVADAILDGVAGAIERRGALNDGAAEAIDYFDRLGLRLALASSSPMRLIRTVISIGGLEGRFEVVHSAEREARGKPDPAVYLSTAQRLGVVPERCLAIEDSVAGTSSAKAAGMVCIAIPEDLVRDGAFGDADLVLGSLAELDDRIWERTGTVPAGTVPG